MREVRYREVGWRLLGIFVPGSGFLRGSSSFSPSISSRGSMSRFSPWSHPQSFLALSFYVYGLYIKV